MLKWWCDGMLFIDCIEDDLDVDEFAEIANIRLNAKEYVDATSTGDLLKGTAAMTFFAPVMWIAKVHYLRKYRHQKSEEEA